MLKHKDQKLKMQKINTNEANLSYRWDALHLSLDAMHLGCHALDVVHLVPNAQCVAYVPFGHYI